MERGYLIATETQLFDPYFILVLLVGLYVSIKLRFPQFRYLLLSLKIFSGAMDFKGSKGQLIHSQAFFAGTGSSILFGATIGAAFGLAIGGIGSLFWLWITAFLIIPIEVVSTTLAIKFRTKLSNGRYLSGPMYFIEKALKAKWLAIAFTIMSLITVLTLGGTIPTLSITYIANQTYGFKGMFVPLLLAAALIFVVIGGIRRIGRVAGFLAPLALMMFLIFYYFSFKNQLISITDFIAIVITDAFNFESMTGGSGLGLFYVLGQSLGTFFISTETGIGKNASISGVVRTDAPIKHGLVTMLSPIIEGLIIATLVYYVLFSFNATTIASQKQFIQFIFANGTKLSFLLLILSYILFVFVGICGWFYIGEQGAFYLSGEKFANFYKIVFVITMLVGSYLYIVYGDIVLFWFYNIGYTSAIITSFPVIISILLLAKVTNLELKKYMLESGAKYEIIKDFYILLISAIPKNLLSKLFGLFTYMKLPRFLMIPILKAFAKTYKINVNEAELQITEYNSLNQFFTRALKAGARIVDSAENAVISPVDAKVTSFGDIKDNTIIQAKGFDYSVKELLGSEKFSDFFLDGKYITFYLSPQDYHRIHSPFYGKILGYYYAPGKLFPVNELAVHGIKGLYPKNERLITYMQTEYGKIAVVKVGASNVGKIRVTYDSKIVTNSLIRIPKECDYSNVDIMIQKGAELGRFEMGSTVILVFEKDTIDLINFESNEKQQYGNTIGYFRKKIFDISKSKN